MPPNVVAGALIQCSMGSGPFPLSVLPSTVLVEGRPAATIMDQAPFVNIPPFGMCKSMAFPPTLAATIAAGGSPTPAPCLPSTVAPWAPGSPTALVAGRPALTSGSQCACAWGGVISVVMPGAMRTASG